MINPTRTAITARFKAAFEQLEKDGEIVRHDRNGKGISDVAETMFGNKGYGHLVTDILNGKRYLTAKAAHAFCERFGLSKTWLLTGSEETQPQPIDILAERHYRLLEFMEPEKIRAFYLALFKQKPDGGLLARLIKNAAETHIGTEALEGNGTADEQLEAIQVVNRGNASLCSLETLFKACGHGNVRFVDVTPKYKQATDTAAFEKAQERARKTTKQMVDNT